MFKIRLMNDFLGNFRWLRCISCGVWADARIMMELGTPLTKMKHGEVHPLDGGFGSQLGQ